MIAGKITGYTRKGYKKLFDKVGALEKGIKMRRMEPYANIIGDELGKYNQDDNSRTMMFKLVRNPVEGTTTRKKHTENVAEIAGKIAESFDWLNPELTRVMAKNHDTGHTFLGHSGEWWLSRIKDTYAMGNYAHNALGARKLIYRQDIVADVEKAIKEKEPNISPKKLAMIKRDLWLIIDGINCHNGEQVEYSYKPDFSKSKKRFFDEVMGCFVKKGYDKSLEPATAEGSLMRLCDKISYIPLDLVDTFRNGCNIESATIDGEQHNFYHFYQEYREKFKALGMPDDSLERLLACKTEEEYDQFAKDMQEIFIEDVKKNSRRNNIRMSKKMSDIMHGIRDINNRMMVNYVVMKEDHEVYPAAMEELMNRYAKTLLTYGLINRENVSDSSISKMEDDPMMQEHFVSALEDTPGMKGFSEFIAKTRKKDFEFTVNMVKKAFEETIDSELEVAKLIANGKIKEDKVKAKGDKKERIDTYTKAFKDSLKKAYDANVFGEVPKGPFDDFKKDLWLRKTKKRLKQEILTEDMRNPISAGTKTLSERVALELGAQFLSSLNDEQWKELLLDSKIVDDEKMKSLTRHYSTFDYRKTGVYEKHDEWDNITALQTEALKASESTDVDKPKESFIVKAKRFLGFERER